MKKMHEIFPDGCSSRQLEALRSSWFKKYGNPYTEGANWSEVNLLEAMYWALSMFSSCFAYGGTQKFYVGCGVGYLETYYEHYLKSYLAKGGTKEDFDAMLKAQESHYRKCTSVYAHTDWEGVSYNTIREPDEVCYA